MFQNTQIGSRRDPGNDAQPQLPEHRNVQPIPTSAPTRAWLGTMPPFRPARFVVLEDFLLPAELPALLEFALRRESAFKISEVTRPNSMVVDIDYEHRRSKVLFNLEQHRNFLAHRIESYLPWVLYKLGCPSFSASHVEMQLTASNDGGFFRKHTDNMLGQCRTREITFVYYFYREPKAFTGGELRVYDTRYANGRAAPLENFHTFVPAQNQVVFFSAYLFHEILPVRCPSTAFADSRFTLNGWIHR